MNDSQDLGGLDEVSKSPQESSASTPSSIGKPTINKWSKRLVLIALICPLIFNVAMLILAQILMPDPVAKWQYAYPICGAAFLATLGALLVTIRSYFSKTLEIGLAIISAGFLIVTFAYIYSNFGLSRGKNISHDFFDALYFSIVTSTTLGYGDFTAAKELRLLSAIQSLLGYIYLGFMISFMSNWAAAVIKRDRMAKYR